MARKPRTDSISEQGRIVSKSFVNIKPPEHIRMTKDDMPFFENVISEYARADWTQHALEIASILARTLCDLEREQYELREEGSVSYTEKGTPVANPRKTIVQMHASSILSLRKSLGMDARSKAPTKDLVKQKADGLKNQLNESDPLIAKPSYDA